MTEPWTKVILFSDIGEARVASFGHRTDGTVSYYVSLHLSSGKTVPLFYPAYYDGRWNRAIMEERCDRVKEMVGLPGGSAIPLISPSSGDRGP
jgi:hypothetical protein